MRTVYLMRHAHAEHRSDIPDIERQLDERGKKEARHMGKTMVQAKLKPDMILCSPAHRAFETATLLAEEISGSGKGVLLDSRIYKNDEDILLSVIQEQDDRLESLLIVGHNPSITYLAHSFSTEMRADMPTAGIVAYYFSALLWEEVQKSQGKLFFFETP